MLNLTPGFQTDRSWAIRKEWHREKLRGSGRICGFSDNRCGQESDQSFKGHHIVTGKGFVIKVESMNSVSHVFSLSNLISIIYQKSHIPKELNLFCPFFQYKRSLYISRHYTINTLLHHSQTHRKAERGNVWCKPHLLHGYPLWVVLFANNEVNSENV